MAAATSLVVGSSAPPSFSELANSWGTRSVRPRHTTAGSRRRYRARGHEPDRSGRASCSRPRSLAGCRAHAQFRCRLRGSGHERSPHRSTGGDGCRRCRDREERSRRVARRRGVDLAPIYRCGADTRPAPWLLVRSSVAPNATAEQSDSSHLRADDRRSQPDRESLSGASYTGPCAPPPGEHENLGHLVPRDARLRTGQRPGSAMVPTRLAIRLAAAFTAWSGQRESEPPLELLQVVKQGKVRLGRPGLSSG